MDRILPANEYTKISDDSDSDIGIEEGSTRTRSNQHRTWPNPIWFVISFVAALSLVVNAVLWRRDTLFRTENNAELRQYANLPFDKPVIYDSHTDFWGENETLADELWDSIDIGPVAVVLSKEYQEEHNLPPAGPFPWDQSKGLYFVKAFHDLHCLKLLRYALVHYERGLESALGTEHIYHCLDALRQDIICKADDTPMPGGMGKGNIGLGQKMQCRDWNKLVAWTQQPERHGCFRQLGEINDYKHVYHTLEEYAYCPEDSPYQASMTEYFEKHGHRDPFEE